MKFALLFALVALATYVFREVFTKRERKRTVRGAAQWVVPLLVAAAGVVLLLFFNLNFNGKII